MVQTPTTAIETGPVSGPVSLEAFLQMPETHPASEWMAGKIIQKPMPKGKHSRLQKRLILKAEAVLWDAGVAEAFPELRCVFGGRVIVPDVAIFQLARIPHDADGEIANGFEIVPDWVIEILSPDQGEAKVVDKILHCLDHGCEMGWMIDPAARQVITYPYNDRSRSFTRAEAIVPVPKWAEGVVLSVGELFGWLTA
jgi:Uma2 family endonuclease